MRAADETDLFAVAYAGGAGWGEDADLDLVGACAAVERDLREREWEALERLIGHVEDDRITVPDDLVERDQIARDFATLGWERRVPADEPALGTHGTREGATPPLERFLADRFAALECYLAWATPDTLILPVDDRDAAALAAAIVVLGWTAPGPPEGGWE